MSSDVHTIIQMGDECFRMDHRAKIERLEFDLKVARSELGKADQENNAAGQRATTAEAALKRVEKLCDDMEAYCGGYGLDVPRWVTSVRSALAAPESPVTASTPSAPGAEAHGEAGEAQEGSDGTH